VSRLMTANPRFLSQCAIRMLVRRESSDIARIWYGSRLGVLLLRSFKWLRMVLRNKLYLFLILCGISHSLGSHSEGTCILGINSCSSSILRPEKYILVYKSLRKRLKVRMGFRFIIEGTGQNSRPSPMTDGRHLWMLV